MNDILKFISKSLIPFGYHLRPYKGMNFMRIPQLEKEPEQSENITNSRKSCQLFPLKNQQIAPASLDHLTVFLRTCVRDNRNTNKTPRLSGADDLENVLRCSWSLIKSLNNAKIERPELKIRLVVLDDRSSDTTKQTLQNLLNKCLYPAEFQTTQTTGQGSSLHQQFEMCKSEPGLVYCVEDDYLHEPDAIERMLDFYKRTALGINSHLVIYPQEHGILYSNHYPSYILAEPDGHWRTMRHATHTFLTHSQIVKDNWDCFENTKFVGIKKKRRLGSEARTTNRLFDLYPGFSPLKPCAVHLQYESLLPPYYNWRPLWDASQYPEKENQKNMSMVSR
ncbi:MAG: glycosyltransferase [Alphaproteobacteria bacterium]|nr:glycosyltransferase [Alphaproteobacteria bacterium]